MWCSRRLINGLMASQKLIISSSKDSFGTDGTVKPANRPTQKLSEANKINHYLTKAAIHITIRSINKKMKLPKLRRWSLTQTAHTHSKKSCNLHPLRVSRVSPSFGQPQMFSMILSGGIPIPLKNMKVSWDDYSQYMESHKIHVPNHFRYKFRSLTGALAMSAAYS
jgi:hypothetical protein